MSIVRKDKLFPHLYKWVYSFNFNFLEGISCVDHWNHYECLLGSDNSCSRWEGHSSSAKVSNLVMDLRSICNHAKFCCYIYDSQHHYNAAVSTKAATCWVDFHRPIPLKSSIIGWRKRRHYEIWGGFFHKRNICQQPAKITAMGMSLSSSVRWQCSPVWTTHNCHNFAEAFPHQAGGNPPSTLFTGPERNVMNKELFVKIIFRSFCIIFQKNQ